MSYEETIACWAPNPCSWTCHVHCWLFCRGILACDSNCSVAAESVYCHIPPSVQDWRLAAYSLPTCWDLPPSDVTGRNHGRSSCPGQPRTSSIPAGPIGEYTRTSVSTERQIAFLRQLPYSHLRGLHERPCQSAGSHDPDSGALPCIGMRAPIDSALKSTIFCATAICLVKHVI